MAICTDTDFVNSLTPEQHQYFIDREEATRERLQSALRDLSRGIAPINALGGEALALVLNHRVQVH